MSIDIVFLGRFRTIILLMVVILLSGMVQALDDFGNPNNRWIIDNYPDLVREPNKVWLKAVNPNDVSMPSGVTRLHFDFSRATGRSLAIPSLLDVVDTIVYLGVAVPVSSVDDLNGVTISAEVFSVIQTYNVTDVYKLFPSADKVEITISLDQVEVLDYPDYYGIKFTGGIAEEVMISLREYLPEEDVFYAPIPIPDEYDPDPDSKPECDATNEEYSSYQWYLKPKSDSIPGGINALSATALTCEREIPTIAVLDAGFVYEKGTQLHHPDYAVSVHPASEPHIEEQGPTMIGHGVGVVSLIAAGINNYKEKIDCPKVYGTSGIMLGQGIAGVAPGVTVLLMNYNNETNFLQDGRFILDSVAALNIKVWHNSWGLKVECPPLVDLIKEARYEKRIHVVGSGGNCKAPLDCGFSQLPACEPSVIAVGGSDSLGNRWSLSNTGDFIDVIAPAKSVIVCKGLNGDSLSVGEILFDSLDETSKYAFGNGTSYAAPLVSGLIALMYAIRPDISMYTVEQIIMETTYSQSSGWNEFTGWGIINAGAAVNRATELYCNSISGDVNSDCYVNLGDVFFLMDYVFANGPAPENPDNADPNGDCSINVGDIAYLSNYVLDSLGVEPPPLPGCVKSGASDPVVISNVILNQNYPNPFNPVTTISYELPQATDVELTVFNILGQKVTVLVDEYQSADQHEVMWNSTNSDGLEVANGIYFYRIQTPISTKVRKMVLLK